eukprot:CAMPEP_0172472886 /NCGR_PEP_ID=MMETSP1065-20121228/68572_1 /TAXON_ID=265537 /ORGANISM="Amphiprora paludosa, Strain CCMP125" /LENGTH=939 /DNA_ID=CAMNT_0013231053 /DNA_START=1728 /DNA_END=4547 /DNA_ORIENTATION=+
MQPQQRGSKVVAGYALQQKLGSGSFAVVYKGVRTAPSPQHPNTVAIKAIARSSEKLTKKVLQNLEIEITILRTYRHKNIVCLHDVQKTDHHFYLMLEYCAGGDVQGLIRSRKSGRLTEGLTRRLMRDLSAGLRFLWGQELIHRDIKPQNLLLTGALPLDEIDDPDKTDELYQRRAALNFPSGQFALKIADFGFARHLQTTSLAETLCGSPLYMAPEILQHHRYDAKADLWSVGTVLFEMIAGRPPFHGENHIDLLRNIQRKAVRLPADVKVSKECVNLLRLLLNRNPLSRAGFKEFFEASDALVALGCRGPPPSEEDTTMQRTELGTIQERPVQTADSMLTVATHVQNQPQQPPLNHTQHQAVQPFGQPPTPATPTSLTGLANRGALAAAPLPTTMIPPRMMQKPSLAPLVPSPPASGISPSAPTVPGLLAEMPHNRSNRSPTSNGATPPTMEMATTRRAEGGGMRSSTSDNSFVMVGHGSFQLSPTTSGAVPSTNTTSVPQQQHHTPLSSPPASPYQNTSQVISTRGDYMVVKQPKGMLSTSPGTGGALMGMLTGRARLLYDNTAPGMKWDTHISNVTKMLAASEDVGRRAISVAHLGDNRAYSAMKMLMIGDASSSSLLSGGMEGIEEEEADSGAVTDDSSSTEIMASVRRRRSSSMTDRSMPDMKDEDEGENEMPFALAADAQSPPILSAGMPTRVSTSFGKSTSITSSARQTVRPTPALIRSYFGEALSCYLKALKMLKGAVHGAQGVERELQTLSARVTSDKVVAVQKLMKRCQVTIVWLGEQYKGVLERAEASNSEVAKIQNNTPTEGEQRETPRSCSVEELIFNNALAYGREGAVKQLLGQLEASRSSYRSAGLLAETLLMESNLVGNDRKILEDYVDGFAARITELDELILQRSKLVSNSGVGTSNLLGSRRAPGVVSLVGQPYTAHKLSL